MVKALIARHASHQVYSTFNLICCEILQSSNSVFSTVIFGLPETVSVTVGVTVIVLSQGRLSLTLAQTILVPLPVKVPHVPHVQSRGRGGDVRVREQERVGRGYINHPLSPFNLFSVKRDATMRTMMFYTEYYITLSRLLQCYSNICVIPLPDIIMLVVL